MDVQEFELWGTDELIKRKIYLDCEHIVSVQQLEDRELRDVGAMTRATKSYPPGCRLTMINAEVHIVSGTDEDIVKKWTDAE